MYGGKTHGKEARISEEVFGGNDRSILIDFIITRSSNLLVWRFIGNFICFFCVTQLRFQSITLALFHWYRRFYTLDSCCARYNNCIDSFLRSWLNSNLNSSSSYRFYLPFLSTVATFSKKGVIKGKKKGTATITIKSGKITKKCKVKVK